jgi:hypothetical protein
MGPGRCRNPRRVALSVALFRQGTRMAPSEGRSKLWGAGCFGERSSRWQSAREEAGRNPGQGLRRSTLEGRNPWEAPAVRQPKQPPNCQALPEGSKPRNRGLSGRSGDRCFATTAGKPLGETVGGSVRIVIVRIPSGRGNLRRVNPRSAAGTKQDRRGFEGSKPSRG